jgi:hypothetical protein
MAGFFVGNLELLRPLALGLMIWCCHFLWSMNKQSATRRRVRLQVLRALKAENDGKEVTLPGVGTMGFMRNHPRVLQDLEFIRADRLVVCLC